MPIRLPATRTLARASFSLGVLLLALASGLVALLLLGARALAAEDAPAAAARSARVVAGAHEQRVAEGAPEPRAARARPAEADEARPGGTTTLPPGRKPGLAASLAGLGLKERFDLSVGRAFFRDPWVTAPSTTTARDGLGPLFNAHACASCHPDAGRGTLGAGGGPSTALLLRLARPAGDGPAPDPVYGDQLQTLAIAVGGAADAGSRPVAEGRVEVEHVTLRGAYADGTGFELAKPLVRVVEPAYGPLAGDLELSPRLAPALHGVGLLAAVPEDAIRAGADPGDANGDGISGRPNLVRDRRSGTIVLGRFGWKAAQPTLRQQIASALRNDVGITNELYAEQPCSAAQAACLAAPDGRDRPHGHEISPPLLDAIERFTATRAVAARPRAAEPEVRTGRALFGSTGCAACHTPSLMTGDAGIPEAAGQTIWPYTDLLLHDMGADLADGVVEGIALGGEWRTPPLWGVGRAASGREHASLLHDGRARTLEEAILWHGGEGRAARDAFVALSREQRRALLAFLESL